MGGNPYRSKPEEEKPKVTARGPLVIIGDYSFVASQIVQIKRFEYERRPNQLYIVLAGRNDGTTFNADYEDFYIAYIEARTWEAELYRARTPFRGPL